MCFLSSKSKESGCFGSGDVLEVGRSIGPGTNPQGESRLLVKGSGAADNTQGRRDRAKGWVDGVAIERDSLTVLFVLLRPPADANGSDGFG